MSDQSRELEFEKRLDADENSKDRQFVSALARGLEVLRAFQPGELELSNQELSERTGLPKPTVTRLTYTLTKLGYLTLAPRGGSYQLGAGVLALGYSLLSRMDLRLLARPQMEELANDYNATVALGTRDRLRMVYIEACRGPAAVALSLDVGSHIPIATSAMGRAFLAIVPEDERNYLLDHVKKHEPDQFPHIRDGVEKAINDVKTRGFCLSIGDWQKEVHAAAVPIKSPHRSGVFAINCGGPSYRMDPEVLEKEIGPRLVDIANFLQSAV